MDADDSFIYANVGGDPSSPDQDLVIHPYNLIRASRSAHSVAAAGIYEKKSYFEFLWKLEILSPPRSRGGKKLLITVESFFPRGVSNHALSIFIQ